MLAVPRSAFEEQLRAPGKPVDSALASPGGPLPPAEDGKPRDPLGRLLSLHPPDELQADW